MTSGASRCMSAQEEVGAQRTAASGMRIHVKESAPIFDEQIGNCMVCGLGLGRTDDVVWCRHCGRLAHRHHLIQWILRKGCCPNCGNNLEEKYYR